MGKMSASIYINQWSIPPRCAAPPLSHHFCKRVNLWGEPTYQSLRPMTFLYSLIICNIFILFIAISIKNTIFANKIL